MKKKYRRGNFKGNMKSFDRQSSKGEIDTIIELTVMAEAGTCLEKGHFPKL